MAINRAIVLFPNFSNLHLIHEIRETHDPLYNFIAPHLTLVFPFKSELSKEELIGHLDKQLKELCPFELIARGITGASDGYVFLDVKAGNDHVIELHDKLYSGLLKPYHNRYIPYTPHITIAQLKDEKTQRELVEKLSDFDVEFRAVIDELTIEIIDGTEKSILEYQYKF